MYKRWQILYKQLATLDTAVNVWMHSFSVILDEHWSAGYYARQDKIG